MRTIFSLQICMWINKTSGQCPDSGDGHHWIAVWLGWMIARPTPYPTPPRAQFSVKMASIMEGPLSKWTNVMKGWQYRWFVLDYNAGLLSYYTSKDKMMRGSRRGCVRLRGAVIGIDDEDDSTFTITVDQKTFHFQGPS
ncbi:oxysterol-binding protein-related protein 9-like [Gadus chalcogrammus]|uniref:oxysterol-binding protein-related protein 9-like n=1 Tax=Gadus chalcogrammus TaxID=1042646 RepID=UPI0024C47F1D|nr:oxysterol-binding protein-related protein 9-like [Gadus chalcogrammus]XP_056460301.1 oxysterol-binding protein-related protein 9-like [Gadus chalcogrammus]